MQYLLILQSLPRYDLDSVQVPSVDVRQYHVPIYTSCLDSHKYELSVTGFRWQ